MAKSLVDTGPLVAWLDKGDCDHVRCAAFFADYQGQLITTWPVLTEVYQGVVGEVEAGPRRGEAQRRRGDGAEHRAR